MKQQRVGLHGVDSRWDRVRADFTTKDRGSIDNFLTCVIRLDCTICCLLELKILRLRVALVVCSDVLLRYFNEIQLDVRALEDRYLDVREPSGLSHDVDLPEVC